MNSLPVSQVRPDIAAPQGDSTPSPPTTDFAPGKHYIPVPGLLRNRSTSWPGARAGLAARSPATVGAHLVQRTLAGDLPVGEFRKADLPDGIEKNIADSVAEIKAQQESLAGRCRLLTGLGFALPTNDELTRIATEAATLSATLTGRFSAAKRQTLVRGYNLLRAAELSGLANSARQELDRIYPLTHIPSGRTLNKVLKDIFLAAEAADEYIGYPFLKKYIDRAPVDERKAAGANPRLIELATKRLAGRDDLPAFAIQLSAVLQGSVAHYTAEAADELIQTRMKDWVPDVAIAGKSISGSVAVLKGAAWEKVLRKYQVGKVPESMIRETIETANAFTAPDGKVFISADRGNPGTMIHEGIHFYAPDNFMELCGTDLNEGVTEYFARKITDDLGIDRTQYGKELLAARKLVALAGEDVVTQAYFAGDTDGLADVVIPKVGDEQVGAVAAASVVTAPDTS